MLAPMKWILRGGLLLVTCGAFLGAAPLASAAVGGVTSSGDFGPWFPAPGSFGSENPSLYQSNVQPTSDNSISEIVNFSCTYPSGSGYQTGQTIPSGEQAILGAIFDDAAAAYNGTLADKNGIKFTSISGGGALGTSAMHIFLQEEKQLLVNGGWVRYSTSDSNIDTQAEYSAAQTQIAAKTVQVNILGSKISAINQQISIAQGAGDSAKVKALQLGRDGLNSAYTGLYTDIQNLKASIASLHWPDPGLAGMVNVKVSAPLYLAYSVPEGCGLNPIAGTTVHFLDLINDPGTFFTDLILYIPTNLAQQSFNFLQPYAFIWTFWTPHTERGDTLFNVASGCAPTYYTSGPNKGQQSNTQEVANDCASGQPLGFDKTNNVDAPSSGHDPWYISMAIFLQWFVSGFYFIILFAAAVLYMVRGNRNTQLNVLYLVPKLLAAALLTMFAPFLIGTLVTFSNLFVVTLFSYGSQRSIGNITDILAQSNTYITVAGPLVSQLIQCLVAAFVVFFFAMFILGSLVRQLVLMALVIAAPLAAFCLIVPKWSHNFNKYIRILVVTIFTPPLMAFILKLGIAINPIVIQGGAVDDLTGLIGLLLMVATLWGMTKVLKLSASVATGSASFNKSLTGRTMGRVGEMAGMARIAGVGGPLNPLLGGAAHALNAGARIGNASEGVGASLIPEDKKLFGGAAAGGVLSRAGFGGRGPEGGRKLLDSGGFESDMYGAGPEYRSRSFGQRYQEFLDQHMAGRGERRIPHRAAMGIRAQQAEALHKREEEMGHKLSRAERDEFLKGSYVRDGEGHILIDKSTGQLERKGDGYYASSPQVVKRKGNYFVLEPGMGKAEKKIGGGEPAPPTSPVVPTPTPGPVRRTAESARRTARTASSIMEAGASRTRIGDIGTESASAAHMRALDVATDPAIPPAKQEAAQRYVETHPICPRCAGPMKGGVCINPACRPPETVPRRPRSRVSGNQKATRRYVENQKAAREYVESLKAAQEQVEKHHICPRCGGPMKGSVCTNPDCRPPTAPRRRRSRVSGDAATESSPAPH